MYVSSVIHESPVSNSEHIPPIMAQSSDQERREKKIRKRQMLVQLECLKSQVNPHFLFNNLSILSSLVRIDPALSEQFIDHLSRTYRYILEKRDVPLVALRQEIGFIESFSFLLQIRFSDKFELKMEISDADMDRYKIAPLTLQWLIENAIRHNRMSLARPLLVTLSILDDMLKVSNNIQLRGASGDLQGTGLQTIFRHYALLTHRPLRAGAEGNEFIVHVPLIH